MKSIFRRALAGALLTPLAALASNADVILHHGKIITVDAGFTVQQAVALKAGRIVAVGPDRNVLAAEHGPNTRLIDLQGRSVLPGLIDAHVHALSAGLSEYRGEIPPLRSFEGAPHAQWKVDYRAPHVPDAAARDEHADSRGAGCGARSSRDV